MSFRIISIVFSQQFDKVRHFSHDLKVIAVYNGKKPLFAQQSHYTDKQYGKIFTDKQKYLIW